MSAVSVVNADSVSIKHGLFLTPKSCVISRANNTCNQMIDVQWRLNQPADVCLFITSQEQYLACWQNLLVRQQTFYIGVDHDIAFELRNKTSGEVIFSEPFKVYKKVAKFRRKRRNPWSFY